MRSGSDSGCARIHQGTVNVRAEMCNRKWSPNIVARFGSILNSVKSSAFRDTVITRSRGQGRAIAQQLVKARDSRIEVASEEGQGATLVITLPAETRSY